MKVRGHTARAWWPAGPVAALLLAAASLAVFFLPTALPGGEAANRPLIVVRGVLTGQRALVRNGLYYLPASLVRDYLDPAARVINRNGLPVLTTGDLRVDTGYRFLDDYVNGTSDTEGGRRSLRLEIPLLEEGWGDYLPADLVETLYGIRQRRHPVSGLVILEGRAGTASRRVKEAAGSPRINLTWEQVTPLNPDTSRIGPLPGVNVVSPTWFHLVDSSGEVSNYADLAYTRWAHGRGYRVWGLVTNSFDPDLTRAVLETGKGRRELIRRILAYALLYELDGINVDFENVYPQDGPNLVRLTEELTPLAHRVGLTVSIDVTVKSPNPTWSLFFDRRALGRVVDYVVVMAYDETPAASPVAGPVASLPWVEKGLVGVLEEVPREKLLLGVPFYTRLWKETPLGGGRVRTTSLALSMEEAESLLRERGLTPRRDPETGQLFAAFEEGGSRYRIWLEDDRSMAARASLVVKYGLAGIASWRRGYEKPAIWNIIATELGLADRVIQKTSSRFTVIPSSKGETTGWRAERL